MHNGNKRSQILAKSDISFWANDAFNKKDTNATDTHPMNTVVTEKSSRIQLRAGDGNGVKKQSETDTPSKKGPPEKEKPSRIQIRASESTTANGRELLAMETIPRSKITFRKQRKVWEELTNPDPSEVTSRMDVVRLTRVFDAMLRGRVDSEFATYSKEFRAAMKEAELIFPLGTQLEEVEIYDHVFCEVIRQVHVHCVERGVLLERIRSYFIQHYEEFRSLRSKIELERKEVQDFMEVVKKDAASIQREKHALRHDHEQLIADLEMKDARIAALEEEVGRRKEREGVLVDVLRRIDSVVDETGRYIDLESMLLEGRGGGGGGDGSGDGDGRFLEAQKKRRDSQGPNRRGVGGGGHRKMRRRSVLLDPETIKAPGVSIHDDEISFEGMYGEAEEDIDIPSSSDPFEAELLWSEMLASVACTYHSVNFLFQKLDQETALASAAAMVGSPVLLPALAAVAMDAVELGDSAEAVGAVGAVGAARTAVGAASAGSERDQDPENATDGLDALLQGGFGQWSQVNPSTTDSQSQSQSQSISLPTKKAYACRIVAKVNQRLLERLYAEGRGQVFFESLGIGALGFNSFAEFLHSMRSSVGPLALAETASQCDLQPMQPMASSSLPLPATHLDRRQLSDEERFIREIATASVQALTSNAAHVGVQVDDASSLAPTHLHLGGMIPGMMPPEYRGPRRSSLVGATFKRQQSMTTDDAGDSPEQHLVKSSRAAHQQPLNTTEGEGRLEGERMRNPKMTASSSSGSVASRVLTGVKKDRDSKHDLDFVKTFRNMNQRMNKLLGEPLPADVKCKSLNWIRRTVREQYANKMVADAVDDRIHNLRASMGEFLYNSQSEKYGFQRIVEGNCLSIIATTRKFAASDDVCATFLKFLEQECSMNALNMFLRAWQLCDELRGVGIEYPQPRASDVTSIRYVCVDRCVEIGERLFPWNFGGFGGSAGQKAFKDDLLHGSVLVPADEVRSLLRRPAGGGEPDMMLRDFYKLDMMQFLKLVLQYTQVYEDFFQKYVQRIMSEKGITEWNLPQFSSFLASGLSGRVSSDEFKFMWDYLETRAADHDDGAVTETCLYHLPDDYPLFLSKFVF